MAIPFAGGGFGEFFSRPGSAEVKAVIGRIDFVSPGYLEALHTRLLAGRYLTDADNQPKGPRVAVISEWTARTFFPKGDAIGQTMNVRSQVWQVVGVIADVVDRRLDVPRGAFAYVPSAFNPSRFAVALRTPLDPLALVSSVRSEVARIDPGVAVARPRALDQAMAESMSERRVVLALVGTFAVTALALAAIGLYGVMAYTVATRRREFGVRMAFGATAPGLIRHVLRDGLRVTGTGVVLGLVAGRRRRTASLNPALPSARQRSARHRRYRRHGHHCRDPGVPAPGVARIALRPDDRAARLILSEGLRPSDSPTRALTRRFVGALRSRGSLRSLARVSNSPIGHRSRPFLTR